jgi:hypothetical protein
MKSCAARAQSVSDSTEHEKLVEKVHFSSGIQDHWYNIGFSERWLFSNFFRQYSAIFPQNHRYTSPYFAVIVQVQVFLQSLELAPRSTPLWLITSQRLYLLQRERRQIQGDSTLEVVIEALLTVEVFRDEPISI